MIRTSLPVGMLDASTAITLQEAAHVVRAFRFILRRAVRGRAGFLVGPLPLDSLHQSLYLLRM